MDTVEQVMSALEKKGSAQTRKTMLRHGAPDNIYGVKVADLKTIAKKIKGKQELALELYETGNYDAQYLAGLVADGAKMTKRQLDAWAKSATCAMISEYTVAWVASESRHGRDQAIKWMKSKRESIASSGWNTYASLVSSRDDNELDLAEVKELLKRVAEEIEEAPNKVRYVMNGFVIAVGCYCKPLLKDAKRVAKRIGSVSVDMGETACKVPNATDYIKKVETAGRQGKKRTTVKC